MDFIPARMNIPHSAFKGWPYGLSPVGQLVVFKCLSCNEEPNTPSRSADCINGDSRIFASINPHMHICLVDIEIKKKKNAQYRTHNSP